MRKPNGLLLLSMLSLALLPVGPSFAAPDYPSRPITIVVPYGAGGPSDVLTRIVAERMRIVFGQRVVIENVTGAAGRIGTARAARMPPDGYTLVQGGAATHVVHPAMHKLSYDVVADFEPVSLLAETTFMVVGRKNLPANNLRELISWLKAKAEPATQGTTGVGSTSHLAGILLQKQTGTRLGFVPYRSTPMTGLVAGEIDLLIDQVANALPQVRSGTIKPFVVAASRRLTAAPDIPSTAQAGLPNFQVSNWVALFAPNGTPKDITSKING